MDIYLTLSNPNVYEIAGKLLRKDWLRRKSYILLLIMFNLSHIYLELESQATLS